MYLHIGGEYTISEHFIVGMFDMDSITFKQGDMLAFLKRAEEEERVEYVSVDIPRSIIVTLDRIYLSPISTSTLRKRFSNNKETFI